MPLIQPAITHSADGLLHLYRVVALDHAIRQGALFPRWLPDLAYGYGLPLFVFYAPLSYYLTEGLHLLGLDLVSAFNASFALALLAAGSGTYLFVKDLFGPKAGILAAVAYVYAPYQLFNIYSRGSLPVAWAGALFPFAFWSFGRLMRTGWPAYLVLSAMLCGLALLAHNISNLLFLPLLLLYLAVASLVQVDHASSEHGSPLTLRLTHLLPSGLALVLGLGLTAFFWIPAIIENQFIQIERVITPPDFDFHANFVNVSNLFSFPQPANTGLLNPDSPLTLGPVQVGLAAVGLLSLYRRQAGKQRSRGAGEKSPLLPRTPAALLTVTFFAIIGLIAAIFMMLPLSTGVWERLPLIAFVQQPHRLLGLAAFLLALLAGSAVVVWPERLSYGLTLGGAGIIFVTTVPLLYPRYYQSLPAAPTLTGMMAYEHATGAIGTTSFGEYLPIWVQQTPRESPLEPMYQTGTAIERLDLAYLPPEATIEAARYGFNRSELVIISPQPYQAIFHTFYFPGWQALIDGRPGAIAPVSERGLIGVPMPAGRHQLQLRFGETPVRLIADGLSVLALIIVVTLNVKTHHASRFTFHVLRTPDQALRITHYVSHFTAGQFFTFALLALVLIIAKAFYFDRYDTALKHTFDGTGVAGAGAARQVNFGHRINLLGYDLNHESVAAGKAFDLTLYWQARQSLATDFSALVQLVDEQQHIYAGQDNLHPGSLPTSRWEPWGFVQDHHSIQVPPGTPPGAYFLVTGLYDPETWARLAVIDGGDPGWSDVVAIPVTVEKPSRPPDTAELGITWPVSMQKTSEVLDISEVSPIRLLGATPERNVILLNDTLRVALFWEAIRAPTVDYRINLRLLSANGTAVLEETAQPSHNRYPTTRWAAGERVRDNHALWIPPDFAAGTYRLQVRLVDQTGQPVGEWLELGKMSVAG